MKSRNFANKLLLVAVILLVLCSNFTLNVVPITRQLMPTEAASTRLTKTYLYDQLNYNQPTNETLYEALGIKTYNNYLMDLSAGQTLNNVVVVVVDSGLDVTQPVFENRVLTDFAMDFSRGYPTEETNTWNLDENGHGTHVAGIIADITLSNVKILPIKIFYGVGNESTNYYYSFLNAIRYIHALKTGTRVSLVDSNGRESERDRIYFNENRTKLDEIYMVNMSLGTEGFTKWEFENDSEIVNEKKIYQSMIDYYLLQDNVLPIVAAGNRSDNEYIKNNQGEYIAYYSVPGACNGVLAVSAYNNTAKEYELASFSYYNDNISVAAPGCDIWSACTSELSNNVFYGNKKKDGCTYYEVGSAYLKKDPNGNFYSRSSGTSMATPFVTACYAMVLSDSSKNEVADYGLSSWEPDNVATDHQYISMPHKALLSAAATDGAGAEQFEPRFGYGTINVSGFVPVDGETQIQPFKDINYQPFVNNSKDTAVKPKVLVFEEETTAVDWFAVCVILAAIVIAIWLIKVFKDYCASIMRRKETNDNEQY